VAFSASAIGIRSGARNLAELKAKEMKAGIVRIAEMEAHGRKLNRVLFCMERN